MYTSYKQLSLQGVDVCNEDENMLSVANSGKEWSWSYSERFNCIQREFQTGMLQMDLLSLGKGTDFIAISFLILPMEGVGSALHLKYLRNYQCYTIWH